MAHLLVLDPQQPDAAVVARLAALLRGGEVIAIPTDTVYGLAAHALDWKAVASVFALKGREADKPLPVLIAGAEQARALAAELPPLFWRLAEAFWPGPLTLAVPAAPGLPAALLGGGRTVALRHARAPIANALLAAVAFPLTATSANRSGEPAARNAEEVGRRLGDRLAWIVDGGPAASTLPSTVLDLGGASPRIVREGAIPAAALAPYLR